MIWIVRRASGIAYMQNSGGASKFALRYLEILNCRACLEKRLLTKHHFSFDISNSPH